MTINDTSVADQAATHHPYLSALVADARAVGPLRMAVAYPCDAGSIRAVAEAANAGLISPVLVGPRTRMRAAAERAGLPWPAAEVAETQDEPRAAAAQAVKLCREGHVVALMKGSLHTDELLSAALSRESGLRGHARASHAFVMDIPASPRPLLLTDCVVNIAPTLAEKRDILQNAINLARALGIAQPKAAILAAVETVNPAMPSTLDAAALCKMVDRGQITGAVVDGPLAFDNAVSAESAQNKGIVSPVAGSPDVLLVPGLEVGNMLYKQLVYLASAECAGLVLGMKVPIVLTSRSDSSAARVASCALAVLAQANQPRRRA